MTNAVETARAALEALKAATPDYCSPDRAAHDAKVDAAWKAFVAAKDAEKHAAQVAAAYSAAMGCSVHVSRLPATKWATACTAVEIAGRYHYVSGTVELVDASSARCTVTGNRTTLGRTGKGWKVQAFDAQGSRYAVRYYSNACSALRGLTNAL